MPQDKHFQIDIEISRPNQLYNYTIRKKKKYWGVRNVAIYHLIQFLIREKMLCEKDIPISYELLRRALTTDLMRMPKKWGEVGEEKEGENE